MELSLLLLGLLNMASARRFDYDDDYEYENEEDDDCDEECMDDGLQLLQIGLGILGALIAFCCCGCFCKWFCADDEKSDGREALSAEQPQPIQDGGGLSNPQQHPGYELQQASSGFQVQPPTTFSAHQQEQAPGSQSLPQAGNFYQTQQLEGFQAPMGSHQPQPTGYSVYPPPEHHMMEPHFNPPPPLPYLGPPQGVLPTNNQLQQSSAGFQPPQQPGGFQAPSLQPQPATYYPASEQQTKKTTSPVKQNSNSASSNQIHIHIHSNKEPSSIKERESFPVKQKEETSLAMPAPPDPNAWQAPSDPYARQAPYSPYPRY